MTFKNYHLYFPIQLWRSKQGQVRLVPPRLMEQPFTFLDFFWMEMENVDHRLLSNTWSLDSTFWAFHPGYSSLLGRGYITVLVTQNGSFPYETREVRTSKASVLAFHKKEKEDVLLSFGFVAYTYPFPRTSLLFFQIKGRVSSILENVVLCEESGCPPDPVYNILPNKENKEVSCYDLFIFGNQIFVYVYRQEPKEVYFRMNGEGICLPSSDPRDYSSITDCIRDSYKDKVLWYRSYTQTNNRALQEVMLAYPHPKGHISFGTYWVPALWFFLVSIIILILLRKNQ